MKLNGSDKRCRYLHAPGTQDDRSAFGALLKKCGIELPRSLTLERIVELGWVTPVLRVILPETALRSWLDYPLLSMHGVEECPDEDQWALSLYARAMSSPPSRDRSNWWVYFLDDPDDQLTQAARANAIDPSKPGELPPSFRHSRHNQEIRPWMDYFAYWQVFELADYLFSMTCTLPITEDLADVVDRSQETWLKLAEDRVEALERKWLERRAAFEWLSRMRTVLGSVTRDHTWDDIDTALRAVAENLCLTPEQMRSDIRDTLLVMWQDWTGWFSPLTRQHGQLLELLRQEIEYAVFYLERITGQPTDFLDESWYDAHQRNDWACLIDALPREEELARRDFPRTALMYLHRYETAIPQIGALNAENLRQLLSDNWQRSRPLRRFVLAVHRLHTELRGEDLMDSESVIRGAERIEQFNLIMMHAERTLSLEFRERTGATKYPEIRKLAKDTLNHLLCRWSLTKGSVSRTAQQRTQDLLEQHAMLHDLDPQEGLHLVSPSDIASGSDTADHAAAMLVNFVIARNYAAHHDAVDSELVYPTEGDAEKHPGGIAITSALGAVIAALCTRDDSVGRQPY